MKALKNNSFTLIEIMIVVAIVVVIAVFSLLEARRVRMNTNDMVALQTIRSLAIAMELYAVKNNGAYPADLNDLVTAQPPYFYANICDGTVRYGYQYVRSPMNGYTIEASPQICGQTGTRYLTVEAGLKSADISCGG